MSTDDQVPAADEPTCIGCGFRPYFDADKSLHPIQISIGSEDWPELKICDDCAYRMAAELGHAHLLPDEIQRAP